ncbi:YbaY family lipoprotein [Pseudomonas sp. BJa5]|uniref:YbaY family lipoprotein n=1 Tax=Pseudomonas sp. BJa5 TaxID=2936270 RepID=UPI00255985DF|nr:YbaY family lipoprotein [Pseudomonas sp. BGr12]MDL2422777.1 YbaY family lipoprotein [Pseudomonas sp. BGr12]
MNNEITPCLEVEVFYLERMALPGEVLVSVNLEDVSRQDVAALTLASQSLRTDNGVPFTFKLRYDPSVIKDNHVYSVRARIEHEGRLIWTSTSAHTVDLNKLPGKPVHLRMEQVSTDRG